jgi:hypothetical protein
MCAAMLFLVAVHILSIYVFAVHQFTLSYDDALSEKAHHVVEEYVRSSHLYERRSPELVSQTLLEAFPFIKQVACAYTPTGLHIDIKAHDVCLQLDDGRCVTKNNRCIPAEYIVQSQLVHLPLVHAPVAPKAQLLPEEMFNFLTAIEPSLLQKADIDYKHNYEIICRLHKAPFRIISNHQKMLTQEQFDLCCAVAQDVENQADYAVSSADIRFDGRIVVAKLRDEGAKG